jgi:hypothetical protein
MNNSNLNTKNWLVEPLHPLSIWLKISIIAVISVIIKSTPTQPSWAIIMVLFAALFLIPIGFQEISRVQSRFKMSDDGLIWHLPCAVFLALSFLLERSNTAGIFALPYATWCMETFLRGIKWDTKIVYLSTLTTFGFLTNASLWLLFDRLGVQPLGFSTWIVILTGVHFHFAGFTLMASLTLFLYQNPDDKFVKTTILSIMIGVILTATGITTTQLGYSHTLETIAGVWMAFSALLAGFVFIKHSFLEKLPIRIMWLIGGTCLILAMVLAFLYAMRSIITLETLTMPFMQAIHGTLNALGFGPLVLLGWAFKSDKL